ncbi:hypothetical protein F5Y14DRAFT_432571 [Nemania sp. NC0429]|nr:hypothetical protein F5Y14DRAFT_432571 [Nemania sp. NC0429]
MVRPQSTNFQFITSINTVAHDEETRRKVRSHARRQKLSSENIAPPQSRKSTTQKERTSKFRLKPSVQQNDPRSEDSSSSGSSNHNDGCNSDRKSLSISKLNGPILGGRAGNHNLDHNFTPTMLSQELALVVARELPSFPMLRIETTPLTETLLKYCFTVCLCPQEEFLEKWFDRAGAPTYMMTYYSGFLANAFAMNPDGNFFDALHVDTAITHAFMALVASMHNSLAQWNDTRTFDFHRLQAIKAINERLNIEGKSPNVPISDGITMAVALLVNNETFTGSIQAAAAHMSGLKRIVDLRGGILEGFKYIAVVQRALVWADFSYAYAAGRPLMFPFVPQLASTLSLHDRFQGRQRESTMGPSRSEVLVVRDREIVQIFELIYSITECLATFDYNNLSNMSAERVQLSDSIYVAEWRLFQLEESYRNLNLSKRADPLALEAKVMARGDIRGSPVVDLSESLMLAGHLFVHLALRGQPPAAPRHRGITESLVLSLCDILFALDLLSHPEPYGSPRSYYSVGSLGNSSVESWSTTTSTTSIFSNHSMKPDDEFAKNSLLWILFIGSCVRAPTVPTEHTPHQTILLGDHHRFFIYAFKKYCLVRYITNKETLAEKLKDVAWLNSWCENQLNLVWAEISDHLIP